MLKYLVILPMVIAPAFSPTLLAGQLQEDRIEQRETGALGDFSAAIENYADLRRRLGAPYGGSWLTADPEQFEAQVAALARAIREARAHATAGELFTPAESTVSKA